MVSRQPIFHTAQPGLALLCLCGCMAIGCGVGAQVGRGIALYKQGKYAAAEAQWSGLDGKYLSMNRKGRVRYLVYRGLTLHRLGREGEARRHLERGQRAYNAGSSWWLPEAARTEMTKLLATTSPAKPVAATAKPMSPRPAAAASSTEVSAQRTPAVRVRPIVAVFAVRDASGKQDRNTLDQLSEYLAAQLTAVAGYKVVPPAELRKRLTSAKRDSYKACYETQCQIELGRAVAAQKSLATKLLQVGTKCATSAVLYDLRSEAAEHAATVDTDCSADALLGAMKAVANKLSGK